MSKNIYIGDIHGSFKTMCFYIEEYDIRDCNLIQVGDLGLGFNSLPADLKNLETLNEIMKDRNIHFYAIRGNHDDPEFWYGRNIDFTNLHLVQDYEVLEIGGDNILFCGGGISIDRSYRDQTKTWFKGEEFVLDHERIKSVIDNNERIDVIVTHSAPTFFSPEGIKSSLVEDYHRLEQELWGTNLKKDLLQERKNLEILHDEILEYFDVKFWVYGHFHSSDHRYHRHTRVDGKEVITKHVLLDIMEFKMINSKEDNDDENINENRGESKTSTEDKI